MKVIIAGSRSITSYKYVEDAVALSGFDITEVVSGTAGGVDTLGELWAKNHINGNVSLFPADWDDINVPENYIKINKFGKKYNSKAGFMRNQDMADYADALIAVHNGSPGTRDMISRATKRGLKVFEYDIRKL